MKKGFFVKFNSIKELKGWLSKFPRKANVAEVLELFEEYTIKTKIKN